MCKLAFNMCLLKTSLWDNNLVWYKAIIRRYLLNGSKNGVTIGLGLENLVERLWCPNSVRVGLAILEISIWNLILGSKNTPLVRRGVEEEEANRGLFQPQGNYREPFEKDKEIITTILFPPFHPKPDPVLICLFSLSLFLSLSLSLIGHSHTPITHTTHPGWWQQNICLYMVIVKRLTSLYQHRKGKQIDTHTNTHI